MSYPGDPPIGTKIRGLVVLCAFLVIVGMMILICYLILGAIFSGFDHLTYLLSPTPLAIYQNLRSTVVGIFQAYTIIIPLSGLGILVTAIYKLRQPGDEE